MSAGPTSTAEYLAALPADRRAALERLRATIAEAEPRAEEAFSYGMPAFRLDGRPLVWYAAWKRHYGLYPVSEALLAAHGIDAAGHEIAKGTIRFDASAPLPLDLLRRLVAARAAELAS